jgi:drug/metabolite transporter (DMT)-like permease
MIAILIVCAASAFQVARNATQRGLMGEAGPWGATLVRFLFGLPFALCLTGLAWVATPHGGLHPTLAFWGFALSGAATQVLATAAVLTAMRHAGFAVGTAWQQSSMPLTAILGWVVFGDPLTPLGWIGVALATLGLAALAAPQARATEQESAARVWGAVYGLLAGLCFAVSFNTYRHATLELSPGAALLGATATVSITQAAQSLVLVGLLAWRRPAALRAVAASWKASLAAGFAGACASALWLTALGLAPAAVVRAVGVIEAPMAAVAGRRLFAERLSAWQWIAGATTAVGVALTAFG